MTLRVAAVQAEAIPGDVVANIEKAARLTAAAAAEGARLVVFPEAFATGYDDAVFDRPLPRADDLAWLAPVQAAVETSGTVVVLNSALDHGARRALTSLVLAPGRAPWAAYDKQHLHAGERAWFAPGAGGASVVVDGVEVALSVCYDANFPEHAAAAAADGARVYVNAGAYFPGGAARRDLHYAARALDNGMYVVFSGLVGAPSDFIGGSAVFDPLGRRVAHVESQEGLAVADVDPAVLDAVRDDQRMWADRRASFGARRREAVAGG
ncbi:carbon-nitrogen hydrolase family protein [Oerskovia turbata]